MKAPCARIFVCIHVGVLPPGHGGCCMWQRFTSWGSGHSNRAALWLTRRWDQCKCQSAAVLSAVMAVWAPGSRSGFFFSVTFREWKPDRPLELVFIFWRGGGIKASRSTSEFFTSPYVNHPHLVMCHFTLHTLSAKPLQDSLFPHPKGGTTNLRFPTLGISACEHVLIKKNT